MKLLLDAEASLESEMHILEIYWAVAISLCLAEKFSWRMMGKFSAQPRAGEFGLWLVLFDSFISPFDQTHAGCVILWARLSFGSDRVRFLCGCVCVVGWWAVTFPTWFTVTLFLSRVNTPMTWLQRAPRWSRLSLAFVTVPSCSVYRPTQLKFTV